MNILSNNLRSVTYKKRSNSNRKLLESQNFYEQKQFKNNTKRPAQAISFGGSAVSMAQAEGEKLTHKVINFVYENEAAYNAIYSLLVAGIMKPLCVMKMPGSEEKDKQIVATKNFLQAFIGSFLGLTVGGGIVKKATDVIKNNLSLITQNKDRTGFVVSADEKKFEKAAIKNLEKEKSGFKTRYLYAKDKNNSTLGAIWEALTKKAVVAQQCPEDFNPDKQIFVQITQEGDIKPKIKNIKETVKQHLGVFNKPSNVAFFNRLKTNGDEKLLLKKKEVLVNLVKSGANKEQVQTEYKSLIASILDNSVAGAKKQIEEKSKEIGSSLNKENVEATLDSLFDFIKDKKASETLMETYESVWKQSTGWITAIGKAKISSILLPTVMAALFAKRNARNKQKEIKKENSTLTNSKTFNQEKTNFKNLIETSALASQKLQQKPSFTGNVDKFINALALGVENISASRFGKAAVNKMHNLPSPLNKTSARMGDIESTIITGYWVQNTIRSKKIDPDQKLGLNVHTVLVTLVSSAAALVIDTALDPIIKRCKNKYTETLTNASREALKSNNPKQILKEQCKNILGKDKAVEKLSEILTQDTKNFFGKDGKLIEDTALAKEISNLCTSYGKKLSKFKSLTVFTAVVRFLVPVLMVPISGKLKKYIKERKIKKDNLKNEN